MKQLDSKEILTLLEYRLKLAAQWPTTNPSLAYKIRGYLSLSVISLLAAASVISALSDLSDFDNMSFGVCCGATAALSVIKQIILCVNKEKFFEMLNLLKNPLFASHENNLDIYLQKKIRICNLVRIMYLFANMSTCVFASLAPLHNLSERSLPIPFPLNMKQQPVFIYLLIWILQSLGAFVTSWSYVHLDMLICTCVAIAAGQLEIVREKIIHSTDCLIPEAGNLEIIDNQEALVKKSLRECYLQHVVIERYISSIEEMFSLFFLLQLIIGVSIIITVGLSCLLVPIASFQFVRNCFFFVTIVIILAIFCIPGNEIILHSENIRFACYMTQWDKCGTSIRKTLILIMKRCDRPFALTAGKFTQMSLATLLVVMKSAFSYFTVLWKLYSEENRE